jgi:hypothetical protein
MRGDNPAQGAFGSMTPSGMTVGQGIGFTPSGANPLWNTINPQIARLPGT